MRNLTDLEIIESVKKGNQSDFALIVDRYKGRAFSLLKRMLRNDMDAEEVLQDCFLKSYNALSTFRHDSKFSTWFYRIVYNTALTKVSGKKRKIQNEMSSVEDNPQLESSNDFRITEEESQSEFIKKLIDKLPVNYASVINMFYINEMSCEEISEVMETSVANVKVLLYRSRNALRDIMEHGKIKEEIYE
jgi:RNA polymerase sigma factor (sigma-70 family)